MDSDLGRVIDELREHNIRIENLLAKLVTQRGSQPDVSSDATPRCSFCGRPRAAVAEMVKASNGGAAICGECVEQCRSVIKSKKRPGA